jgi:MarR family
VAGTDESALPPLKFLTNHGVVLLWVGLHPDSRISEIADQAQISRRSAQMIVTDLAERGYVVRQRVGRRTVYSVDSDRLLRGGGWMTIGDFLGMVPQHHPWRDVAPTGPT